MSSTVFVVLGIVAMVGGVGVFAFWRLRDGARDRQGLPLVGTVALAFGLLALVTGWLLTDGGINRGEALKTGGLAAGSVVALYALWLNDRRRRVEEQRQEIERRRQELENQRYSLENQRAEHDRERVADERFARAVEMLGHDADQVRVGALHALAGLARSRPGYTQTVLDVLCSYLRRPFDHYRYAEIRDEEWSGDDREADRERQVRITAQRLIADLLPAAGTEDAPRYDLDLHGATLEYFDISTKVIGQLRARQTNLYESISLWELRVHGPAWFTGAHCWGRFYAHHIVFHDRSWFSRFTAQGTVDLEGARFLGDTKFANGIFHGRVSFRDAEFAGSIDFDHAAFRGDLDLRVAGGATAGTLAMTVSLANATALPSGWTVEPTGDPAVGLIRA
jgi:hypothetical protein